MTALTVGLRPDDLFQLFPFHLVFNRDLQIVQSGAGWLHGKIRIQPGLQIDRLLRCVRPTSGWNFDHFCHEPRSVCILKAHSDPLTLRGGMRYLPEHDAILFLGSPWITQITELDALHLNVGDFPPHDALPDLLFLLQAQRSSLGEMTVLTDELTQAKEASERSLKVRDQFIANMSHELRTPINGIIGMSDLIRGTNLSDEGRDYLSILSSSAQTLLAVVNDILDFSKIDARKVDLENIRFGPRDEAVDVINTLRVRACEKGLALSSMFSDSVPAHVIGDPLRIRQVLTNLIGNAVKFTETGEVVLRATLETEDVNSVIIRYSVSDTGIGIAPELHDQIFGAFSQADGSITRKYGGTGLGLAICRQLVELMGGRIWVESAVGQGSTFHVTVPFGRVSEPRDPHIPISPDTAQKALSLTPIDKESARPCLNVLLVEDNLVNQKLAVTLLRKRGHTVTAANTGLAAVAEYSKAQFDIVLMDVQMPVMDGLQATAAIRDFESRSKRRTPIIAVTAHAMPGDRDKCLAAGMDGYVSKPICPEQLFAAIDSAIAVAGRC